MGETDASVTPSPRVRVALALQGACIATVALYAVLRLVQALLYPEPNPATVIWSAHAGYLWRAWTVAYAGAMAGFATFAAAKSARRQRVKRTRRAPARHGDGRTMEPSSAIGVPTWGPARSARRSRRWCTRRRVPQGRVPRHSRSDGTT